MQKRWFLVLISACVLLLLAACREETPPPAPDSGAEAGPVALTVWGAEEDEELLRQIFEGFQEKYRGEAEFLITYEPQSESHCTDALMADLENPLPSNGKLVMFLGFAREKVTQTVRERILEAVDQILKKAYGDKIHYIHKVIYRKSFVWLLETEEKELPELLSGLEEVSLDEDSGGDRGGN